MHIDTNKNNNMYIFSIKHDGGFCYDSYGEHIIVAHYANEVVEIAKKNAADEGEEIWESAKIEYIGIYKGVKTEPFILLSDFRAG